MLKEYHLNPSINTIKYPLLFSQEENISICVLVSEITEYIKINSDCKAVTVNTVMWSTVNVFPLWESSHDFWFFKKNITAVYFFRSCPFSVQCCSGGGLPPTLRLYPLKTSTVHFREPSFFHPIIHMHFLSWVNSIYSCTGCTHLHCAAEHTVESTAVELRSYRSCPLWSVWSRSCFPSVLNWKLALLCE